MPVQTPYSRPFHVYAFGKIFLASLLVTRASLNILPLLTVFTCWLWKEFLWDQSVITFAMMALFDPWKTWGTRMLHLKTVYSHHLFCHSFHYDKFKILIDIGSSCCKYRLCLHVIQNWALLDCSIALIENPWNTALSRFSHILALNFLAAQIFGALWNASMVGEREPQVFSPS